MGRSLNFRVFVQQFLRVRFQDSWGSVGLRMKEISGQAVPPVNYSNGCYYCVCVC